MRCEVGCTGVPDLYPLDVSTAPRCDHRQCLQTWPDVSWDIHLYSLLKHQCSVGNVTMVTIIKLLRHCEDLVR